MPKTEEREPVGPEGSSDEARDAGGPEAPAVRPAAHWRRIVRNAFGVAAAATAAGVGVMYACVYVAPNPDDAGDVHEAADEDAGAGDDGRAAEGEAAETPEAGPEDGGADAG